MPIVAEIYENEGFVSVDIVDECNNVYVMVDYSLN